MTRPPKRSRPKRLPAKRLPQNISELVEAGGPEALARHAAATAARQEREFWLAVLEGLDPHDLDEHDQMYCSFCIRDLRRKLSIRQPKEVIREQTRLRVRRFRERRAQAVGDADVREQL